MIKLTTYDNDTITEVATRNIAKKIPNNNLAQGSIVSIILL